jgi:hypothetical protein
VPGWTAISTVHGPFQIAAQVRAKATTGLQGRAAIEYIVVTAVLVTGSFYVEVGDRTMAQYFTDAACAFFRMPTSFNEAGTEWACSPSP